jgi:hypothetical protein
VIASGVENRRLQGTAAMIAGPESVDDVLKLVDIGIKSIGAVRRHPLKVGASAVCPTATNSRPGTLKSLEELLCVILGCWIPEGLGKDCVCNRMAILQLEPLEMSVECFTNAWHLYRNLIIDVGNGDHER